MLHHSKKSWITSLSPGISLKHKNSMEKRVKPICFLEKKTFCDGIFTAVAMEKKRHFLMTSKSFMDCKKKKMHARRVPFSTLSTGEFIGWNNINGGTKEWPKGGIFLTPEINLDPLHSRLVPQRVATSSSKKIPEIHLNSINIAVAN